MELPSGHQCERCGCNGQLPSVNVMRGPWHLGEVCWACKLCNAWLDIHYLRRTCIHHASCKHHWTVEVHAGFSSHKLGPLEKTRANTVVTQLNCLLKVFSTPFHMAGDAHEWFHEHDSQISLFLRTLLSHDVNPTERLWDEIEKRYFK